MSIRTLFANAVISILMLASCEPSDSYSVGQHVQTDNGEFIVKSSENYIISATRSDAAQQWFCSDEGMNLIITEDDWTETSIIKNASSRVGDDVLWQGTPCVGLYIKDNEGNYNARNVPFDPVDYLIYSAYYYHPNGNENNNVTKQKVSTSSFFWNDWIKKDKVGGMVNFYGVYPRPYDHIVGSEWNYTRNSVIDTRRGDENDPTYTGVVSNSDTISYTFWGPQTDENLSQFDLMFSDPKTEDVVLGIYGNLNKKEGDNVLMPFKHAFSLLQINISKGDGYEGDCKITELSMTGTEISNSGLLNIATGQLIKGSGNGSIKRSFSEYKIEKGMPFQTEMIVPPTSSAENAEDRLILMCKIDDVEYSYKFPTDVKLESGKKYNVNLTVAPSGLPNILVWNGANVDLYGSDNRVTENLAKGKHQVMSKYTSFKVNVDNGYTFCRVIKNGTTEVAPNADGTYAIEKYTDYNVIAYPAENWYMSPEFIRIQFDGKMNSAFNDGSQDKSTSVWQDLSGHNNDGYLKKFDNIASAWDGSGLYFDGIDDIVTFPGTINAKEYTMEFYICFDQQNAASVTPRLVAEGTEYPAYYLRRMGPSSDNRENGFYVGLFGHAHGQEDSYLKIETDNSTIIQLDMAFKNGELRFYKNGAVDNKKILTNLVDAKPIVEASLGNRSKDNTRTTRGTYYSFILYDKALSETEINKNYAVNKERYGETKK